MYIPTEAEFSAGIQTYNQHELRGHSYFEALERIRQGWGDPVAVESGIRLLLRRWHLNFYRFGMYEQEPVYECLHKNDALINALRTRSIESLGPEDEAPIISLFCEFSIALRGGQKGQQQSPVATAKAMDLLAPAFLPLWDNPIALVYGYSLMMATDYVAFCWQMKELARSVERYVSPGDDRTLLKRIDEFNYSVYTKHWISVPRET